MLELGVEDGEDYGDSARFHFVAFCRTGIKKPRGDESPGPNQSGFFRRHGRMCAMGEQKSRTIFVYVDTAKCGQ
jgi:hypothetical protein